MEELDSVPELSQSYPTAQLERSTSLKNRPKSARPTTRQNRRFVSLDETITEDDEQLQSTSKSIMPGGRVNGIANNNSAPNITSNVNDQKLKSRLEQSAQEDVVSSYFKTNNRAAQLQKKAEIDRNRQIEERQSYLPTNRTTWDSLMTGVVYTNDIYERNGDYINGDTSPNVNAIRKPQRLEAINTTRTNGSAKRKVRKY